MSGKLTICRTFFFRFATTISLKVLITVPLWGEFTGDWKVPIQRDSKCTDFQVMALSLFCHLCVLVHHRPSYLSRLITEWSPLGPGRLWTLRNRSIHTDGLMLERRNSSALAVELRLSCINPSIRYSENTAWRSWYIWMLWQCVKVPSYSGLNIKALKWFTLKYQALLWRSLPIKIPTDMKKMGKNHCFDITFAFTWIYHRVLNPQEDS